MYTVFHKKQPLILLAISWNSCLILILVGSIVDLYSITYSTVVTRLEVFDLYVYVNMLFTNDLSAKWYMLLRRILVLVLLYT